MHLLQDLVEVPDVDGLVHRRRDDDVAACGHGGHGDDPPKVSVQDLDHVALLDVPHVQVLAYPGHHELVTLHTKPSGELAHNTN